VRAFAHRVLTEEVNLPFVLGETDDRLGCLEGLARRNVSFASKCVGNNPQEMMTAMLIFFMVI
jgi:hypothetical protein